MNARIVLSVVPISCSCSGVRKQQTRTHLWPLYTSPKFTTASSWWRALCSRSSSCSALPLDVDATVDSVHESSTIPCRYMSLLAR
ncbi:hypothetical protein M413DRAFT_391223 [Hebeloma cylindrosporum]|uniref:Uncharacterized protein n=1 Tax=Hebeloma cylindrosporum TaxID=76867 RepID=A0A0C3BTY6_HEBCY|nr:hypothetical protein M413DRAFT_391223 [Hebeloma cylindrosporum h7]